MPLTLFSWSFRFGCDDAVASVGAWGLTSTGRSVAETKKMPAVVSPAVNVSARRRSTSIW